MSTTTNDGHVDAMIAKAAQSDKPDDAMKFSQAALNAANAISAVAYKNRDAK